MNAGVVRRSQAYGIYIARNDLRCTADHNNLLCCRKKKLLKK